MRFQKSLLLVVLMFLALTALVHAEDVLLRDDWYVLEQDGVPGGFGNDQFFKTDAGYYYRGFFQVNMDFMGTPFLYVEQIDAWVDEEFRLTKTLRVSDVDGAQTRHEAVFTYSDTLTEAKVIELDAAGKPFESYWNWEGPYPIYSASSLVDKAIHERNLIVGAEYTADTWSYGEIESVTFKIEEETTVVYNGVEIPVFIASQDSGQIVVRAHMDAKGISYISEAVDHNLVFTKVEEDAIPELKSIAADVLLVPANVVVDHPYRSIQSLITIDWLDVPMEDFVWEDNRQKIAKVFSENSIQVEINRDDRDFTGLVELPIKDAEFAPYLADTDYIKPSSPLVQSLITEILAGETDAWAATELILDWVFSNIAGKMVPRTLTTEEILASREGKCAEYATLFAALARAAGLPTKIALGERYQGNIWVGHLWNEVWLGEWISVDPSHNQVSPDALLIKFIDSDTVMGTQGVRVGLVNKLGITIDAVEITKDENESILETGLVGTTYQNARYSCEITMPEGWVGLEAEDQGFPMFVMYDPTDPEFSVVLLMMGVPPGTKADQVMTTRIMTLAGVLPNFAVREQKSGTIAGAGASIASWTFNDDPVFVQENQILIKGDVAYLFVLTGPEATWADYQEVSDEIMQSFLSYR